MNKLIKNVGRHVIAMIPLALFAFIVVLFILNVNSKGFWDISIGPLLTPFIAVCITFLATQRRNDQREAKRHLETIIIKIQNIVTNPGFYDFAIVENDATRKAIRNQIQVNNRKLGNSIDSLIQYSKVFKFENEATYIKEQFTNYRELVDSAQKGRK